MYTIKSSFFPTPCKRLVRYQYDLTASSSAEIDNSDVAGAFVRVDYKVWQDEAGLVDKDKIKASLLDNGAIDVDIRLIRLPRHNVRSEIILKTERLRDKIQQMAELRNEEAEWSVLLKADMLEDKTADDLISAVGGVAA